MAGIKVHGDAPGEARTADAEILKTGLNEVVYHLIDTAGRLEEGPCLKKLLYRLGVFGESEKISLFLRVFNGSAAVRALAVYQLGLGPKALARRAILANIFTLENITLVIHLAEDPLYGLHVIIVGRADKSVV